MKKAGVGLKVAAVMNAVLLAVGFIGCQSGAFNWLADRSEPVAAQKTAESAPTQQSVPASANSDIDVYVSPETAKAPQTFMPSTKAIIVPSFGPPEAPTASKPSQDPPLNQRPQP